MLQTIEEFLPEHPFFAGLGEDAIALVAGCAVNAHFRPGEYLFREGEPADTFYVIRHGRVSLEVHARRSARRGGQRATPTTWSGWSWLVPPYRWLFDARATEETAPSPSTGLPARQVRGGPGHRLRPAAARGARHVRPAAVGSGPAARPLRRAGMTALTDRDRGAAPCRPVPAAAVRGPGARQDTRTRTLELEPVDGEPLAFAAGQFTMMHAFGAGEVPISISGDPARPEVLQHTIRDVGAVTRALVHAPPGTVLGIRGPFGTGWQVRPAGVATSCSWRAGSAWRRCARDPGGVRRPRGDYGQVPLLYGARTPEDILFGEDLRGWAADHGIDVQVTVDNGQHAWRGRVGLVTQLMDRAASPRVHARPHLWSRGDDAPRAAWPWRPRHTPDQVRLSMERNMKCGVGLCGHCQLREFLPVRRRPGAHLRPARAPHVTSGAVAMTLTHSHGQEHSAAHRGKPKLAVWKFASCDGCQLTLLNCEDELIPLAGEVEIAYFPEATRAVVEGPYDVSLVEGSITTPEELERIQQVREVSRRLVTIGACATAGGSRPCGTSATSPSSARSSTPTRSTSRRCPRSTPISAHVTVDFELRGCPINKHQLLEVLAASIQGRKPRILSHSVCVECKRRGNVRDRRPRHAVPGPGHPGRLRCPLPELRPRVLRLLRPAGHPQHRLDRDPAEQPRHERAGGGAHLPDVQRGQRGVPRRERAPRAGALRRGRPGRATRPPAGPRGEVTP